MFEIGNGSRFSSSLLFDIEGLSQNDQDFLFISRKFLNMKKQ